MGDNCLNFPDPVTLFVAKLLHESDRVFDIQLEHASLKQLQTVGVVECTRSVHKRIFNLNTKVQWNNL